MTTSEAKRAAAAKVLRRYSSGRRLLTGYAVSTAVLLGLLVARDHDRLDLVKAAALLLSGGAALLVLVSLRNGWAGDALAKWRSDLVGPEELAGDRRLGGTGAYAYLTALLTVAAAGLLTQAAWAELRANADGTARIQHCHTTRARVGHSTTCYGTWIVAGRTYSGPLPGVKSGIGSTVNIRYDPDDPTALGGRSLKFPIGFFLVTGAATGVLTWRWTTARDPYIAEVTMIAKRRVREPG
ncbi:hypothetical protein ACRYCC_14170 [Actinomadura scrupuli]|uniref:hypothetical protein n=1 Tax=Actinomadura scrupuli TaxID=559629 RepID=UPI003D97AFA8